MKKTLKLTAILLTALFVAAACGGAGSGQPDDEGAAPSEPQQTQAESEPESASEETTSPEPTPEESVPAEDEAAGEAQSGEGGEDGASGPSVTTIQGEEVSLGGGDVTALFFMAGW